VAMKEIMISSHDKLECADKFSYLGDLIGAGGGAEESSRARIRCACAKFRKMASLLTSRAASLKVKGKVYRACIQSVFGYANKTWAFASFGYGKIGENGTNDGQLDVWCSLKEYNG